MDNKFRLVVSVECKAMQVGSSPVRADTILKKLCHALHISEFDILCSAWINAGKPGKAFPTPEIANNIYKIITINLLFKMYICSLYVYFS